MSFSSGVFTLVAGNPVVTGTTVSSTWANNTLVDIATGLSTCLLKDGTQTTTVLVPFAQGINSTLTTDSTSSTTGSILTAGGLGVAKALNVGTTIGAVGLTDICAGRLTLTSGTAVTTADVTAATTVYFTPYKGTGIALYDGSATWTVLTFAETSIAVPATTSTMYDLFAYNNAGTLALEALVWTNDTTRATALVLQNGVLVKSGATTRRYLGSFRTTGSSGQTEDSLAKRYVWNYYNRVKRSMQVQEPADSWTYTTATLRQANANAANQLDFVIGVSEDLTDAEVGVGAKNSGAEGNGQLQIAIGLDSTSLANYGLSLFPQTANVAAGAYQQIWAQWKGYPGIGRHTLVWLEYSVAANTTTWLGDNGAPTLNQSGIQGEIFG